MQHRERERYTFHGPHRVSELELLALVIGTGGAGLSTRGIALELMQRFGGAREIAAMPVAALTQVPGLGPARAVRVHAACALTKLALSPLPQGVVQGPEQAIALLAPSLRGQRTERLVALYLSNTGRPLALEGLSSGSIDRTLMDPREIFRPALILGARSLVLAHNHPSGHPEPSAQDIAATRRVADLGQSLGVQLSDHLIWAQDSYTSMAQRGLLPAWKGANTGLTG